jgi:hypothetical protein
MSRATNGRKAPFLSRAGRWVAESVIRWGLNRMAHYQKLSDELIAPNLDQDISLFLRSDHEEASKAFRYIY